MWGIVHFEKPPLTPQIQPVFYTLFLNDPIGRLGEDNLMAAGLQRRVGLSLAAGRESRCLIQEETLQGLFSALGIPQIMTRFERANMKVLNHWGCNWLPFLQYSDESWVKI